MKKQIKVAYFPSGTLKSKVLGNNGKSLDKYCIKCETDEDLSTGNYILDTTFLIDDNIQELLQEESILKVLLDYGEEVFRISKVTVGTRYIDIVARQITIADSLTLWLEDVRPTNLNGQSAVNWILDKAEGKKEIQILSDIDTLGTAYYQRMSLYKALHDNDNSFMSKWGGEVQRRGYTININKHIGIDRGFSIREGKNLTGFDGTSNIDNLVTRAKGQGFNGILGNYIDSPLIGSYNNIYTDVIKYDDVKVKDENNDEGYDTLAQAQTELDRRVNEEFSKNGIDKIKASYTINFVQLEKTEEYKKYIVAERLFIGDYSRVYIPKLKVDIKVRAIGKKFDVLAQKTKEIRLSNYIEVKPLNIKQITEKLEAIDSTETVLQMAKDNASALIKGGLKNSYVIVRENEIIIGDTKDINTMTKVWRWNRNGLGYSSTGYYGTFGTAITSDGAIVADFITAGNINANLIKTGTLTAVTVRNRDGSFQIDLSGYGGADFYTNGLKSMTMAQNKIDFYNWGKNGDYIGSFGSVNTVDANFPNGNPDRPNISMWNDLDSSMSLGYKQSGSQPNGVYIRLDKYNIHGNSSYAIMFYEQIGMNGNDINLSNGGAYIRDTVVNSTHKAVFVPNLWAENKIWASGHEITGGDYAEVFEWQDANIENEDRIGYLVELKGDKIVKADSEDILGIISGTAGIIGDNANVWNNKYLKDKWGRICYYKDTDKFDVDGYIIGSYKGDKIINPDFNEGEEYLTRSERSEWGIVGLLGKLICRDDGTSVIGGYIRANNGIATASAYKTKYKVIERIDSNTIKVVTIF